LDALGFVTKPAPFSFYQEIPEKLRIYCIFDYSYLMTKMNSFNTNSILVFLSNTPIQNSPNIGEIEEITIFAKNFS
jgi:hypothetical protein